MAAIGIDLGTNFTCVGVCANGKVEIIPNEHEKRLTPAYVAFTEDERLYGDSAKHQAPLNVKNTIFNTKRIIGRSRNDKSVQNDVKYLGYDVISDEYGKCQIPLTCYGNSQKLYPEQITAMTIGKMKKIAEDHIGQTVSKAVLSVPACFNEDQRQATINAGRMAGLEVLGLINEPTAAALAYAYDKKVEGRSSILILDFGGGTLEVSLTEITNRSVNVTFTLGDSQFGGEDFDNNLVQYYSNEFRKKGIDLFQEKKAIIRLKAACEKAKRSLSGALRTRISVDSLHDNEPFETTIKREDFEKINVSLFNKVSDILNNIRKRQSKVDEIVLVGGSSRIPKVRQMLQETFNQQHLSRIMNPDEAVAYGAAIQAAILNKDTKVPIFHVYGNSVRKKYNTFTLTGKRHYSGPETPSPKLIKMTKEVQGFDNRDDVLMADSSARNNLENYAYSRKKLINKTKYKHKLSDEDKQRICQECDGVIHWLETNERAGKIECEKRFQNLERVCDSILSGETPKAAQYIENARTHRTHDNHENRGITKVQHSVTQKPSPVQKENGPEIEDLKLYVQSVRSLDVFGALKSYLTSEEKRDITMRCCTTENMLLGHQTHVNFQVIKSEKMSLEIYVEGLENRLQYRAMMIEKQHQDTQKKDEAYKRLCDYISSTRQNLDTGYYDNLSLPYLKQAMKTCDETEKWLKSLYKQISTEEIESRLATLKRNVKYISTELKQKREIMEEKQKQEVQRKEEASNRMDYFISSTRRKLDSENHDSLSAPYLHQMAKACNDAENWCIAYYQHHRAEDIETKLVLLKKNIQHACEELEQKRSAAFAIGSNDPGTLVSTRSNRKPDKSENQVNKYPENARTQVANRQRNHDNHENRGITKVQHSVTQKPSPVQKENGPEIKDLKLYVQSVRSLDVFGARKSYLTSEEKRDITMRCCTTENMLLGYQTHVNFQVIKSEKMSLEIYVEGLENRLQYRAKMIEKQHQDTQKKEEAYKRLCNYISSTRRNLDIENYDNLSLPYLKQAMKTCDETEKWLNSLYKKIGTEEIESRLTNLKRNIDYISTELKQKREAAEIKKREGQKKKEAFRHITDFISSTRQEMNSETYDSLSLRQIAKVCNDAEEWLKSNYKRIDAENIKSKLKELTINVQHISNDLERRRKIMEEKQKQEEQRKKEVSNRIGDFISSTRRKLDSENYDSLSVPYLHQMSKACNDAENWCRAFDQRITAEDIETKLVVLKSNIQHASEELEQKRDIEKKMQWEKLLEKKEIDEEISKLSNHIASIRQSVRLGEYGNGQYRDKITKACYETEEWLRINQKHITIALIKNKYKELQTIVDDTKLEMKSFGEPFYQDRKRAEAYDEFYSFIASAQKKLILETNDTVSNPCIERIKNAFREAKEWLVTNKHHASADDMKSKLSKLQENIQTISNELKNKIKAHEDERLQRILAHNKLSKYIADSYASIEQRIGQDGMADDYTAEIKTKCLIIDSWLQNNKGQIPSNVIRSEHEKLQKCVDLWNIQIIETEKDLNSRHQAYDDLCNYIDNVFKFVESRLKGERKELDFKKITDICVKTEETVKRKYHQLSAKEITSHLDELEKNVNDIWNGLQVKWEVEDKNRAEVERKRDERCHEIQEYVTNVRSLAVFGSLKTRITEQHKRDFISSVVEIQQILKAKKDMDGIEVKYKELKNKVNNIHNKLEQIKNRETLKVKEEQEKKQQALQQFLNSIENVKSLVFFGSLKDRLTSRDRRRIKSTCEHWHQWLNNNSKYVTVEYVLRKRLEFEEYPNSLLEQLKTESWDAEKAKEELMRVEAVKQLRVYIEDVKSFLNSNEYRMRLSVEDKNAVERLCRRAELYIDPYSARRYHSEQILKEHTELKKLVEKVCDNISRENELQRLNLERKQRNEASERLHEYIRHIRRKFRRTNEYLPTILRTCDDVQKWLQCYGSALTSNDIEREHWRLKKEFENSKQPNGSRNDAMYSGMNYDEGARALSKSVLRVEKHTNEIRMKIENMRARMTETEKYNLVRMCNENEMWCINNPNARSKESDLQIGNLQKLWEATESKIKSRKRAVEKGCSPNSKNLLPESNLSSGRSRSNSSRYSQPKHDIGRAVERGRSSRHKYVSPESIYLLSLSPRSHSSGYSPAKYEEVDKKKALETFALLARKKIHDPIYKDKIPNRDKNQVIAKFERVKKQKRSKIEAAKELQSFKRLCKDIFWKIDHDADPCNKDRSRRWYF